jgi:hypothetical protein
MMCRQLRRLLAAEKPPGLMVFLQDVGNIEADALMAFGDEFQDVRRCLNELLRSLRETGVINAQNWKEFFGETE